MKNTLRHQLKTKVTLTSELLNAIRLLQLSSYELNEEITKIITENPLLEQISDEMNESLNTSDMLTESSESPEDENQFDEWLCKFIYERPSLWSGGADPFYKDIKDDYPDSLKAYLAWQIKFAPLSLKEQALASLIIDSIDDSGFLEANFEATLKESKYKINKEEFEKVLIFIQHLDPLGVGARNLREFLLIQLEELLSLQKRNTPLFSLLTLAKTIIQHHLDLLSTHNYKLLKQRLDISEKILLETINIIKNLKSSPYSGNNADDKLTFYIPDIIVKSTAHGLTITINDKLNTIGFCSQNVKLLSDNKKDPEINNYLNSMLSSAKWFLHCLNHRKEALLKVATFMFEKQLDFFTHGVSGLKALSLSEIARALHLHESTVSRIIQNKIVVTDKGVYPLKYFLNHILNDETANLASKHVISIIHSLIKNENSHTPLSDQQIAMRLKHQYNLQIARRTVTKYREKLGILASKYRKNINLEQKSKK